MQPTAAPTVNTSDTLVAVSDVPVEQPDLPLVSSPGFDLEDAGAEPSEPSAELDAGERFPVDAGSQPSADASVPPEERPATEGCTREQLTESAERFLAALASGDPGILPVHERVRYTENGREQVLGLGMWVGRPRSEFARHVLDVSRCSSATEAVLVEASGRIVLGLRLRLLDEQLFEIEAHVVPRNNQYYAPERIRPNGADPWLQPIPSEHRSSALELSRVAMSYFDSAADARLLPPSADGCERRQNGALMANDGSCRIPPGDRRFEQQRFEVLDETTGVVVAMTKYTDYIGMYFIKVQAGTILDIEVVGGANSVSTGW